jgi:hypothetical protein
MENGMPIDLYDISIFEAAGLIGVGLYVGAYGLLQFSALRYGAATFTALNLCAASMVAVSLIEHFNLASALIQGMWIVMSLVGLARHALTPRPQLELVRAPVGAQPPRVSVRNSEKASQDLRSAVSR